MGDAMPSFYIDSEDDSDKVTSLAVVFPLVLAGFVIAAGCWTIFAVAGAHLRNTLGLGSLDLGLLLAMPMAVGAALAVPAGIAAQRVGPRRIMIGCLLGLAVCMLLLILAESWTGYLLAAGGLGLAGGFYSAGLHFVTRQAPARHLGLVLGIFGAGVTGAGFNYYLIPLILQAFSWEGVPLAYLIVLLLVAVLLVLLTEDPDSRTGHATNNGGRPLLALLASLQDWRYGLYFGAIAGSFFSLALWLPDFMSSRFLVTVGSGARLALWFVIPGALAQIIGGALADRYDASRVVIYSLMVCLVALFVLSYPPMTLSVRGAVSEIYLEFALPLFLEGVFIVLLGLSLGSSMGGLQRMVIARNDEAAAFAAGLLLSSACLVAFLLPVLFGAMIDWTGIGTAVFMIPFLLLTVSLLMFARDIRCEERQALLHKGV